MCAIFGVLRVLGVRCIHRVFLSEFLDREPLVVAFGPSAEVLEKIQVGRGRLFPLLLPSLLSLLRVRSDEPATDERERRATEPSHHPTLSALANSGCSSSQP